MELEKCIRTRRSVRRFTDASVTEEAVREVLDVARWAPSWANTQGWHIFAVTGATLERIREALRARVEEQAERCFDLPPHSHEWPPHMRARTQRLVAARSAATGMAWTYPPPFPVDLFKAPYMVFFSVDERIQAEYGCFDAGLVVQSFCLAAHDKGLGTCIMAMAVAYGDVLHEMLPEADGQRFVVGVALGVPDWQAPINQFERQRASLEETVTWAR